MPAERSTAPLFNAAARDRAERFGAALVARVAVYRLLGMDQHGFWVPLTVLFVIRSNPGEGGGEARARRIAPPQAAAR